MARALLGYVGTPSQQSQEIELARLRARVRELQAEISELRAEASARRMFDVDLDASLEHGGRQRSDREAALT